MLMMQGICNGTAEEKRGNSDNQWTQTVLGMKLTKNDKWKTEFIQDIALTKEQISNGMIKTLNDLKGKLITIEIWASSYATRKGASGINYHLIDIATGDIEKNS